MNNFAIKFNQKQLSALQHQTGPMLVVAGAGTGKTSILVGRLAYLVLKRNIPLNEILLLTFTEKAAGEIEERADRLLPYGYFESRIHTFHGLAEKILREFGLEIGLAADFKILNSPEQWVFLKKNLDQFNLNYYRPLGNPNKFIAELLKHFSRLKDENISCQEYLDYVEAVESNLDQRLSGQSLEGEATEVLRLKELAGAYQKYNQLLLDQAYLDFGDLITYCLLLFKQRPNLLSVWRQRCPYIMVDEFQDTNWAQYELIKILAQPNNNLLVVGDDDQAIYKFRGASLANIMQFKEDYPEAKEILLTDNYRSYQEILDQAYQSVKNNNPNRLEIKLGINKKLKSRIKPDKGEKLEFNYLANQADEIDLVAKKIKEKHKQTKANWSDFAILTRSNQVAEDFSRQFSRLGIPNQFMSLRGLYRKPIILDCLAYLRVLNDYHQGASLFRLLNLPLFNIDYSQLIEINRFARRHNLSLFESLQKIRAISNISQTAIVKIEKLVELLNKHGQLVKQGQTSQIFLAFVKESGLIENLDYDRDQEQFSCLNQFYNKIKKFEDNLAEAKLADFIDTLDLEIEAGDSGSLVLDFIDSDTVRIMTVHGAKGLEFEYVFLVGLIERKFPTDNRSDKISLPLELIKEKIDVSKDSHLEEERRLFYVAMTRAKKFLHLSAWQGTDQVREKKLSRFVIEAGFNEKKLKRSLKIKDQELIRAMTEKKLSSSVEQKLILPSRFSFSQLAAFSNCPLQYKLAFILKVPVSSDKASLIFGRVMHTVLYDFLQAFIIGGQANLFKKEVASQEHINWPRLKNIFKQRWLSQGYASQEEMKQYYKQGLAGLKKFYLQIKEKTPSILFLEKSFSFHLNNDIIKGTIDRIDKLADGRLEVIDYKTGQAKEKLEYKDKRQLILYQLFLEKNLKADIANLNYYYLQDGTNFSFVASDQEKNKLMTEIKEQIKAIKRKEFPAKPSWLCQYCDFKEICPWRQI